MGVTQRAQYLDMNTGEMRVNDPRFPKRMDVVAYFVNRMVEKREDCHIPLMYTVHASDVSCYDATSGLLLWLPWGRVEDSSNRFIKHIFEALLR